MSISALNGLTQALQAAAAAKTTATDSTTSVANGAVSGNQGAARVSGPGQLLAKLKQLQQSDPTKFKQVMSTLSDTLSEEAKSTTDSRGQKMLTDLAAKFKTAGETGDLSSLTPPQRGAEGGKGAGGARAGGQAKKSGSESASSSSTSSSSSTEETDPADTNEDGTVSASEALAYAASKAADDSKQASSASSYEKMAQHGHEKMQDTMNRLLSIVDAA